MDYRGGEKNEWMSDYNSLRCSITYGWEVTMSVNINGWVVILVPREYNEWMNYKGREKYKWMNDYNELGGNIMDGWVDIIKGTAIEWLVIMLQVEI